MKTTLLVLIVVGLAIVSVFGFPKRRDIDAEQWRPGFQDERHTRDILDDDSNWRSQRQIQKRFFRQWWKTGGNYNGSGTDEEAGKKAKSGTVYSKYDESGIINCPPDVEKCIPRLGKR